MAPVANDITSIGQDVSNPFPYKDMSQGLATERTKIHGKAAMALAQRASLRRPRALPVSPTLNVPESTGKST